MKILLAEDHADIAGVIFDYFELLGHTMDHAVSGTQALSLATEQHYDVIILDIMLPKMDGMTVCRKLRETGVDIPVLMLTAMGERDDILSGFDNGADDYLVKPFDLKILEARVNALHRRNEGSVSAKLLTFDELSLDTSTNTATRRGCQFVLNPSMYIVLRLLMSKAPKIVTKEELSAALWGDDEPEGNVLRSHVYQLRNLIDKPFEFGYIKTVPKVGYQLVRTQGEGE
ncbi:response regulator transcription factor [Enterovibrio coralii]|uniref:Two-component system response regulator n=1 Tax=Enterovibrio coralii TaxID=294935 RepID=A0A135I9B5_9GAMM|nr:response regulator transcription factor [Enterovibrio coralii]KXF82031.1 two-component system response regulator [Enterovibrio coralii]